MRRLRACLRSSVQSGNRATRIGPWRSFELRQCMHGSSERTDARTDAGDMKITRGCESETDGESDDMTR
eukprot:336025-Pleurochrysis_carterae.AAC.1